jgi:hypothetical protein
MAILALAGCATPYQRCLSPSVSELRTVEGLIGEVQANISRGYRLQPEQRWQPVFGVCSGFYNEFDVCWVDQPYTVYEPVAIDRNVERGKLASLMERREELLILVRQQQAACAAAHPQG